MHVAAMARIVGELAPAECPFGVDYLWDARAALGIAVACGAAFMREVMPGVYESDMGLWQPDAAGLLRERRDYGADELCVLMNVTPEFASPLGSRPLGVRARSAVVSSLADAILVSGPMAGAEPAVDAVREVREALAGSAPVVLNTGARAGQHRRVRAVRRRRHRRQRPQARRRHLEPGRARARAPLPRRRAERLSAAMLLGLDLGTTAVKAVVLDPERGLLAVALAAERAGLAAPGLVGAGRGGVARQRARADPARVRRGRRSSRRRSRASASRAACPACSRSTRTTGRCGPRCSTTTPARTPRSTSWPPSSAPRACSSAPARASPSSRSGPSCAGCSGTSRRSGSAPRRIAGSYDWVAGRLADAEFSERNWALESGLYDLEDADYARDLCAAAGHREDGCSGRSAIRARSSAGSPTSSPARTGLRAGIPVVAGMADHVSSAFAAGLAEHGDLLVKLGGSVDVLACSDRPLLDARLYLDAHPSPGLWLPNGCMASGGSGVRWFQRELAAGAALDVLDAEAAATPPGAEGVVMLPYLLGEKTPVNDPLATGALVGLRAGHGRGHLFRAVLESFAYGVRHHLEVLAEHGVRPDARARDERRRRRRRSGSRSSPTSTGLVLEPVVDHPGSALGAAFAAGMGTGAFAGVERDRALRRARRAGAAARRVGGRLRRALPRLPRAVSRPQAGVKTTAACSGEPNGAAAGLASTRRGGRFAVLDELDEERAGSPASPAAGSRSSRSPSGVLRARSRARGGSARRRRVVDRDDRGAIVEVLDRIAAIAHDALDQAIGVVDRGAGSSTNSACVALPGVHVALAGDGASGRSSSSSRRRWRSRSSASARDWSPARSTVRSYSGPKPGCRMSRCAGAGSPRTRPATATTITATDEERPKAR